MIPSGQRKHSPGNYNGKASIVAAAIHHCSFIKDALDHPSFLTKRGAVHPVNIDNNTNHNNASNNANSKSSNGKKLEDLSHFVLFIYWNQAISTESNSDEMNKRSIFNLQWLKDWAYDVQSLQSSRLKREVSVDHSFIQKYKHAIEEKQQLDIQRRAAYKGLASVDYDDIVNQPSRDGLLGFLDALFLDGAAIVKNSPAVENEPDPDNIVSTIGKAIGGSLSHGSLYGDTFHVKSTTNAINVAYTSQELCPHQDLAYYESKPGFQLLHCASMPSNIIGGESILIDCMAAAHAFRQLAPELFATLTKFPATFVKDREGARMTFSRPHIMLQPDYCSEGKDGVPEGEIVGVHWAPPFEGPLRIHPDYVEEYYRAYAAFELMLDDTKCPHACSQATGLDLELTTRLAEFGEQYTWQFLLNPGEIMVFNNTRMLHGRRKFEVPKCVETEATMTERHLIGAYTNIDDSLNFYRVVLNEMNLHRNIPNVGNGSQSVLPP